MCAIECYGYSGCPVCGLQEEDENYEFERCEYCGDYCDAEKFGEFNGERMCLRCVAAEKEEAEIKAEREQLYQQAFPADFGYKDLFKSLYL